jgi:hypothetical protein
MEILKPSKKRDKSLRIQSDLISEINGIFYTAKSQKYTFKEILEWISKRVYESERYKAIPQYRHNYISGYIRANFHIIDVSMIEQKIQWEGELISTKDEKLKGKWAEINQLDKEKQPKMYWINTDKVYYY